MGVILAASQISLTAIAWSLFPANALQIGVMLMFVRRHAGFFWPDLARVAGGSLLVTLCSGAIPGLLVAINGGHLSVTQTVFAVLGAGLGWCIGLFATRHPIASEIARAAQSTPLARFTGTTKAV